ncbi:heterokaryon incompatibility protein het-6-like protein [Colletotrichum kahawae]|uniref:Heterokaryon incompatibility protein het-6-like protein n=1 Tax=Colletotrichum kahawae TaxID=34407 RepID=A0AAE0D456_COLKA|nr:heterokaryon incompatibility protein het-6-like protein [Colletotrichum kahawae]
MNRWHRSSCKNPLIVVEEHGPVCETCKSSPDLDSLMVKQAAEKLASGSLPPDEPQGQYNLWWPSSVPYTTQTPDGGQAPVIRPKQHTSATRNQQNFIFKQTKCIYPESLASDEFRVLILTPVKDALYPVHVELETCKDDGHPEYETVSYTWGGEDGDSLACKPVFMGPYWDVILQTRNCWELLRHLRPRKGRRTVWVDAICINQYDMQEREEQVGKMSRIYQNAFRVVLYLGPDLAPPTSDSSTYPKRRYLHEFNTLHDSLVLSPDKQSKSSAITLSDLFEREYFRRLWVIQELILSRVIALRVGNVEFVSDPLAHQRLEDGSEPTNELFNGSKVPWLRFIMQRVVEDIYGNDFQAAVELARGSHASDPRDLIFGVLGLIRETNGGLTPSKQRFGAVMDALVSVQHG